ncbi:MAG: RraA family protein [Oscillospiraceae bacterium]|nr:RraA family protein [Oscillospiraceae bacterium]
MASVGFRVYEKTSRPSKELVERFRGLPVANVSDNMNRLYSVDPSIRPVNSVPLLGTAITVNTPSGDNLMINCALELAQPGDVLVVSRGNDDVAFLGSLMARKARNKGLAGIVIDGCVRDYEELKCLDIPVYCRGVSPRGPYKNGPGEVNVPIAAGGQVVFPGDIIIGDGDGLVVVHPWDAEEIIEAAWAQNAKENALGEKLDSTGEYIGISRDLSDKVREKAVVYAETWNSFE